MTEAPNESSAKRKKEREVGMGVFLDDLSSMKPSVCHDS